MSSKLILYGSTVSQPARTVRWFTLLNKLPVEQKLTRIEKDEHKTPEFLKMNFNATVPVLDDNGPSIARYLADRFPEVAPHWYPKDIKQRAKVNMYLDWHHGHTRAHLFKHLYENFTAAKQLGRPYNYAEASKTLPYVQKTLRECNDYLLSDAPYVAGLEQVSLADLFLYCEISQLILMTEPDQSVKDSSFVSHLENIRQWMTKMEQLPHHDEVHKLLPIIKEKFRNVPLIQF